MLGGAALFAWAFSRLAISDSGLAIDWKQIWGATHKLRADYANSELRTPPWLLPLIWPLTSFELAPSWGLAAFATLSILVLSVPRRTGRGQWLLGAALLATAYPSLRQVVDGNLEALVIGGVLLILWAVKREHSLGLAAGALLAAAKIQESWLLFFVLALWLLREWPLRKLLASTAWALALAAPWLLWKGSEWLNAVLSFPWPGSAIDSSLRASLARLGIAATLSWALWALLLGLTLWALMRDGRKMDRIRAGWLVASGLLLGPYAASNSVLTPLALGVIPLMQKRQALGLGLIALYNLPYLALSAPQLRAAWESGYWTGVLLISWGLSLLSFQSVSLAQQKKQHET